MTATDFIVQAPVLAAATVAELAQLAGASAIVPIGPGMPAAYRFPAIAPTESLEATARALGCDWAGGSDKPPPHALDAAVIFAPVGALVPEALKHVRKGGRVVCAGIHMSDIPAFPYVDLWGERSIQSVANLTRADGIEFLELAARIPVKTVTTGFALSAANEALRRVREGQLEGAAVLIP